jgi:hypothetical protein
MPDSWFLFEFSETTIFIMFLNPSMFLSWISKAITMDKPIAKAAEMRGNGLIRNRQAV